ncbi:hypothetical protein [Sanguibacter sp. Z1732]|uniref:hypothetical protein n=1 Tax=Sanguibacter sp. Z1732 TaxID=3435412 RepID=UPI003D9C870E
MTGDRFKDGYASAERHWKARWHQANDDLQKAISEIERLRTNLWALQEQDERAETWREKANRYHARLTAVEAEHKSLVDSLRADVAQIIAEASDEPYREPDHLEDLLGIDPNDTADRLAARGVEYRHQRDALAARLTAVEAFLDETDRRAGRRSGACPCAATRRSSPAKSVPSSRRPPPTPPRRTDQ